MIEHAPQHIAFLHIPKAGGTTLRNILKRQYRPQEIYEIAEDINGDIQRFQTISDEERYRKKLLVGHMSHGLHQFFPGPTACLTMLRNPVERVYSEYRFLSSNPYHRLFSVVSPLTFHQYLELDPTRQASNGQTRLLSGSTFGDQVGIPGIEPLSQNHLDQALANLKTFYSLVGLLERFDESLLLWQKQFKWRYPLYEKMNITQRKSKPLDVSEIDHARQKNQFDLILYQKAVDQFDLNFKRHHAMLHRQLIVFRKLNKLYQKSFYYARSIAKKVIKKNG